MAFFSLPGHNQRRRMHRSIVPSVATVSAVLFAGALLQACAFEWDAYDPRLGASATSSASGSGAGGMTGSSSSTSGSMGGSSSSNSSAMSGASSSSSGEMGGAGGTGAAGGMGGVGGMGGAPGPCGGMYLLTEDFEQPLDIAWEWLKYEGAGTTVTQANGALVLKLPVNSTTSNYAEIQSQRTFDLRNSAMSVEVLALPNAANPAQSSFIAYYDNNNNVRFQYEQGKLYFATTKNGTNSVKASVNFDPVQHRFWRIREQSAILYWETSSDSMSWTIRSQTPTSTAAPVDSVYYLLDVYVSGVHMNLGEARFDNVNGGGIPTGKYCPTTSLQDNFDDGAIAHAWGRDNADNGCTHAEMGGELVITPSKTANTYCGYTSAMAYDLTSTSATVEVTQIPNTAADTATFFKLDGEKGILAIVQEGTDLFMRYQTPGKSTDLAAIPYNPVAHRWWRIREKNGTTYWEVSANGTNWTIAGQTLNPIPVTAFDIQIVAGTGSVVMAPGEAHFDRYNLAP